MITRSELPGGKRRFMIRDDSDGGEILEVIAHRPVPEAVVLGHLLACDEDVRHTPPGLGDSGHAALVGRLKTRLAVTENEPFFKALQAELGHRRAVKMQEQLRRLSTYREG